MKTRVEHYLVDADGNRIAVVLPIDEYERLLAAANGHTGGTEARRLPYEPMPGYVDLETIVQGTKPFTAITPELKQALWPDDEEIDEFIEHLRRSRREGR